MLGMLARYNTTIEKGTIRIDLSGVGAAVIEMDPKTLGNIVVPDFFKEVQARVLKTLPKTGIAVSVIVPLYNEEDILTDLIHRLIHEFSEFPFNTEFLLCENGSSDKTREVGQRLAEEHVSVRLISIDTPSYGNAIREGVRESRADLIVVFNADLWCKRFFWEAVLLLEHGYDIVVGSKRLITRYDQRPFLRKAITAAFNTFLKYAFGFKGTDTHGMKALRRTQLQDVISRCRTSKEVFDTEMILKAARSGLKICEIPTEVRDTRPARISLLRRIPSTVRDLYLIWKTL